MVRLLEIEMFCPWGLIGCEVYAAVEETSSYLWGNVGKYFPIVLSC